MFTHTLCLLNALTATLTHKAWLTGAPLRQLVKSREEQFEQRFAKPFGQVSGDDLPAGTACILPVNGSNTAARCLQKVGGWEKGMCFALHTAVQAATLSCTIDRISGLHVNVILKHTLATILSMQGVPRLCQQLDWGCRQCSTHLFCKFMGPRVLGQHPCQMYLAD